MSEGKVLYGVSDGVYVLKFVGEVRLDFCTTIDNFVERLVQDPALAGVIVDLSEARQIDSTSLGLLAKLSVGSRSALHKLPTLICGNAEMLRFLTSMGFEDVFHIIDFANAVPVREFGELPPLTASESETRRRVLEAHRVLMQLSEHNRQQFSDLVRMLEDNG